MSNYGAFLNIPVLIIAIVLILALVIFGPKMGTLVGLQGKAKAVASKSEVVDVRQWSEGVFSLPETSKSKLGTGKYHCEAYRIHPVWGPCVDYTVMPEPMGDVRTITSGPKIGALFCVVEGKDGILSPYTEYKDMTIVYRETPGYAWRSMSWDSARRFWTVPQKWYQSMSNWVVLLFTVIDFIVILVVLGG